MVIDYVSLRFYLGSGQTVTGQIRLYESDNYILRWLLLQLMITEQTGQNVWY